jgi:uncharacterized membrane-anchored protein
MEVRTTSKEDLINMYRSADMLYAAACKQPDAKVYQDAERLRDGIAQVLVVEFKLTSQEEFNRLIYMVN